MRQPRILVVEDEVIVARTIANQLNQFGYDVVDIASSGPAAIAKATQCRPDLVLMDVVLKGEMDGVTAARQIRSQLNIPIVFLTAYADESTLNRAKETQPLGYIVKPFDTRELRVAVELALFKHQVERELQENRDYLATLLRCMSDAVVATDHQGCITFMNPAAEALTGWQPAEAIGKHAAEVLQLIDEVTELPIENPITRVLQDEQIVRVNDFTALVTKDGRYIPIGDSASPLRRRTGEMSGAVFVFWDDRARRQTEILQKALEKERELNHLKSQFISIVSHEFRNPLAVVRTAAELLELQREIPEDKRNSYLRRIKTSVKLMNQLMEDVLLMGRVEAGRLQFRPALLNLEQFCRELVEECAIDCSTNHTIVFHFQGNGLEAVMDENLLRHIFTNLLSNAIKYSPTGGTVAFEVNCSSEAAVFRVQDQGIGIPTPDQTQLFDSFFRASNASSIQGTGLGLAIVKRCVELHQGQIELFSEVGVGTLFMVTLPLQSVLSENS